MKSLKLKLKKGDQVVVIAGKDKGKTGVIDQVLVGENRVIIDGINMIKRHLRKTGPKQSGRIVERPASIHASNVALVDPETKKPTRIGRRHEDGKIVRFAKKSGKTLS